MLTKRLNDFSAQHSSKFLRFVPTIFRDAFRVLGVQITKPNLIFGGDGLYTRGMLFVGMSKSVTPL
jgi:hypothetical protein